MIYLKTSNQLISSGACEGNEPLDLIVYCHAGLFALQHFIAPAIYRDLGKLAEAVQQGWAPETLAARVRRVRNQGLL